MIKKDTTRDEIVNFSLEQLDKPYIHGMHGPDSFDCAGLVWYIYNELLGIDIYENGYGLSTTTKIMTSGIGNITLYKESLKHKNISLIKRGDILLFHRQSKEDSEPSEDNKYPGHCGIYLGDNQFIHAKRSKGKVIISNLNKYWKSVLVGSMDILDSKILKR